jgi:hypothetical protein
MKAKGCGKAKKDFKVKNKSDFRVPGQKEI